MSVSDSYTNTQELLVKFPILNETPVYSEIEKNIQNRLLNGFENWNRGFDAWKEWGDILYTPESLYNVHAVHLTLTEYQNSMKATLRNNDIQMGDFKNMVICDDWAAIHYEIATISRATGVNNPGSVMEFVHFKDYGPELGTRVVEGWAGTRGADYAGLGYFQTPEEREAQKEMMDRIVSWAPAQTDDPAERFPVMNPTTAHSEKAEEIRRLILKDFECWNQGAQAWKEWADWYYAEDLASHSEFTCLGKKDVLDAHDGSERLYFESLLISGDWAAIHYRTRKDGEAGSRMQFLKFVETGSGLQVTESWNK